MIASSSVPAPSKRANPSACLRHKQSRIDVGPLLFLANFVSYYLEITIFAGDNPVFPNVICFLIGSLSIVVCMDRVTRPQVESFLVLMALFTTSAVLSSLALADDQMGKRATSALQIVAAFVSGFGCLLLGLTIGRRRFSRMFFAIWLTIIVGSALELWGVLRPLSDAARALLYRDVTIYADVARDDLLYGSARPNFFGREPSLVGIHVGLAMSLWYITTALGFRQRALMLGVMALVSLLIVRSPTILYFIAISALADVSLRSGRARWTWVRRPAFAALLIINLAAGPMLGWLLAPFGPPLSGIVEGGSFFLRQIGPQAVALQILAQHPFWGVGIGAYASINQTLMATYTELGAFASFPEIDRAVATNGLISNAFWEFWMFFGFLGGSLIVFGVARFLASLGVRHTVFVLIATALAMQNFGGVATFRVAFVLVLFATATLFATSEIEASEAVRRP